MCIDSGCPAKQLIYQFLYLKFLPTEDLKAWGTFGKLVIPAPYLWLSRFLFVPPLAEDEIMISVCSCQFFKIFHLFTGSWYLSINLSLSHTCMCSRACSHTQTHTHTLIISQCPFLSDHSLSWPENLPLWGKHLHSRTRILHLLPPRNHPEFHSFTQTLSPWQEKGAWSRAKRENESSTEKWNKVMLTGAGGLIRES